MTGSSNFQMVGFRFTFLPTGLLGIAFRLFFSDITYVLFMIGLIVSILVTWILGCTTIAQETKNPSPLRVGVSLMMALVAPVLLTFLVFSLGRSGLLFSVACLTVYYVGVQWLTRNQLTLSTLLVGGVSCLGTLTGVFWLDWPAVLSGGAVYGVVAILLSGLLARWLGVPEKSRLSAELPR